MQIADCRLNDCRLTHSNRNLQSAICNLKSAISCLPISEHVYHRRVQFPETDAAGIVHFTNFFKYVEEAEHSMWRAAGLSIATERDREIGWPRVAASFEYRKPLKFEDEFDVHLRVAEKTPQDAPLQRDPAEGRRGASPRGR